MEELDPAPPVVPPWPPRVGWLIGSLVAIGLLLRLPLMSDSIWFDEACMSSQRIGTFDQLMATMFVDIHPPLYIAFMHLWNSAFGDGAWSMRTPPLLAGLASIPLLFAAGRRLVGDNGALWAAGLLALSPVHVWYSTEARLYSPMVLCALLAVYTSDRILRCDSTRPRSLWLLHLANLAVMLALHYYMALYVVLLAMLAPLVAGGFTRQARRLIGWHGTGILLLSALVYAKHSVGEFATSQDYLRTMSVAELDDLLFGWCWTGGTLHAADSHLDTIAAWAQQTLAMILTAAGLLFLWRNRHQRRMGLYLPLLTLAIPGFLLVSAWAGLGHTYIERSCLPALPFLLLLIGAGLAALPPRIHIVVSAVVLLLATAALIALFLHRETVWTVYKPRPDWRGATAWLSKEIDQGGGGRPVFTSMPNPRSLSYYDVRIQDVRSLTQDTRPEVIAQRVEKSLGSWLSGCAEHTFRRLDEHNQNLLAKAELRVYRSTSDPSGLDLTVRTRDDFCYLLRNEWHPSREADTSIEDLLANPRVKVLETARFAGISVYKVSIAQ